MSPTSHIIISIIIFGLSVTVPALIVLNVAKTTKNDKRVPSNLPLLISLFLIAWFITANIFGYTSTLKLSNMVLLASIPMLFGITVIFFSKQMNALSKNIPLHWLISLQVYRVLGLMFLYLYTYEHFLSKGFAMFAGAGDISVELAALPVAYLVKIV